MRLALETVGIAIAGQPIVEEVSLVARPGEMVGLIGPNGSGKSTLLRSVYRVLRPRVGRVLLDEAEVWKLSAKACAQRVGAVVQESSTEFEFSVREVVELGRTPHKGLLERDNAHDAHVVATALGRVEMTALAERPFASLSGGEKQRTLVARALAQEPDILILDEPTNHLDIHHQLELLELLKGLGLTTLITLHDLNLAAAYCERLYLLHQGRLCASGTPAEVLTPGRLLEVFKVNAVTGRHPLTGRLHLLFESLKGVEMV